MNHFTKYFYLSLVYLFFYLPIAIIIIFSFNNATYSALWHGFTLQWYRELFQDQSLLIAALHSLSIGVLAASLACVMGTLAAVSLFRYVFKGKKILYGLVFVLIVLPEIVVAIALLMLFSVLDLPLGFWTLLLAHTTFCLPFVTVTVLSRMSSMDKRIFEAARILGANDYTIFKRIIIPMMWPAIIAGWLLSFTLSLDDVIISYFVTGPGFDILPLKIYSMVRLGVRPEINALCSLLLALTLILVTVAQLTLRKKP
jgi:spermidine/putrescine transport system permease protein